MPRHHKTLDSPWLLSVQINQTPGPGLYAGPGVYPEPGFCHNMSTLCYLFYSSTFYTSGGNYVIAYCFTSKQRPCVANVPVTYPGLYAGPGVYQGPASI